MDEDRKSWKGVPNLSTLWVNYIESKLWSLGDDNKNLDNKKLDIINKKLESLENIERSTIYTKIEIKNDSCLDLYERMKALNSPLEKERQFEPHHRSPLLRLWQIIYTMKRVVQ